MLEMMVHFYGKFRSTILFQFNTVFVVLLQQIQTVTFAPFSRLPWNKSSRQMLIIKRDGL